LKVLKSAYSATEKNEKQEHGVIGFKLTLTVDAVTKRLVEETLCHVKRLGGLKNKP